MNSTLTNEQQVFMVFYAIFWGYISNVQSKWKSFAWGPALSEEGKHARHRLFPAIILLNVLPFCYFGFTICILNNTNRCLINYDSYPIFSLLLRGVIPAFGIFSFYRFWVGIIASKPEYFYSEAKLLPSKWKRQEPSLEKMKIVSDWGCKEIIIGFIYLVIALFFLLV
jgi:hypothetical protein